MLAEASERVAPSLVSLAVVENSLGAVRDGPFVCQIVRSAARKHYRPVSACAGITYIFNPGLNSPNSRAI